LEVGLASAKIIAAFEHCPLLFLAGRAGITVPEDKHDVLLRVTGYNIESRYPEERAAVRKRYTREYTEAELRMIQEVGQWLQSELKPE